MEIIQAAIQSLRPPEDPLSDDPNLSAETGFTSCHQCSNSIDISDQAAFVDRFKHFIRLRCVQPDCLSVDWYTDSEIESPTCAESDSNHQESHVWVHDLLLGVSFRDPGGRA